MKKYKKVLSLICVCLLFCNMLTVVSLAAGTGTQADPFIITTAEELQNINNNVSAHYKLGANIDLADMDFTPIGNADSGAFSGSFDGNGYKISNLNVFSGKYAGLFGSNEGIIKNVILEDIYVYGTRYIGGVVGQNTEYGTLENCSVLSGLVETEGGLHNANIGGICGINEGYFVGSFSNSADVNADVSDVYAYAGGVCGYWNSSITKELADLYNTGNISSSSSTSYSYSDSYYRSYSGGLVGYAYSTVNISNSYNTGDISSSSSSSYSSSYSRSYSGGLVGYAYSTVNISNSYNTGDISSSSSYSSSYSSSFSYSGGLVGYADDTATISGSYNTGKISSSTSSYGSSLAYSGGVVGYQDGNITATNCYNTGNISSSYSYYSYSGGFVGYQETGITATNCYNTGNVSSSGSSSRSGDFVGGYTRNILNCYSLGSTKIIAEDYSYRDGQTLTSEEMKNQLSYSGWDFEEVWSMDGNTNSGYPVLNKAVSPLTLNISNEVVATGKNLQLKSYKNGVETKEVTWSVVSDSTTVNSNGLVVAGAYGFATITATDKEGNKANCNIYVIKPATSLTAKDITITRGTYSSVSVVGGQGDFVSSWESSNTDIVKVSSDGYLTPVSVGTATITITTAGGISATQKVTVTDVATSISLPSSLTVNRGTTQKITATTSPTQTSSAITWKSSDPTVATVDNEGNVTGLKIGSATITATTDNGLSSNCVVTVNAPLVEMAFETPKLTLYKGQTYKLKLNIEPTDTTETITYSSSSSSRASVSSGGVVTIGTSTGTVTITATSSSGKKATCEITVKDWPSVLTVVDSNATISEDVITTGTTGIRNLDKLVKVNDGYTIDVTYSHTTNGLNYCGTGTVIDVYDDYGNFVISYTLVVTGDVNGDSICNVLDVNDTERMSTDALTFSAPQAYAANGTTKTTVDVSSYQYVLNKALAE